MNSNITKTNENLTWANEINIAITVSDMENNIVYMNKKSQKTFSNAKIGNNLKNCHKDSSNEIIETLKKNNTANTYTVQKNGVKKLIHQTPWYNNGIIAGLVEISIELPEQMIHKNRDL